MGFVPIHPALTHLPIAFVLLSVAADFCARLVRAESRRLACRTIGFWSLAAAVAGAALAIAAGYWDAKRDALNPEMDSFLALHMTLGWILSAGLLLLLGWRWLIWHRGQMTIGRSYLGAGALLLGLTLFQGWYGGEMVFSYGAGVAPAGQGTEALAAAQSRLAAVRDALSPAPSGMGGAESPGGTNQAGVRVEGPED